MSIQDRWIVIMCIRHLNYSIQIVHVNSRLAAFLFLGAVPAILVSHISVRVALVDQNAAIASWGPHVFYT